MTSAHMVICKFNPLRSSYTITTRYFVKMSALPNWKKVNSESSGAEFQFENIDLHWMQICIWLQIKPKSTKKNKMQYKRRSISLLSTM